VGLVFVVAFAIAVLQTVLVQGQMHLDELQQQISDTQAEAQRLRMEAAALDSPTNIVQQAEAMGMVAAPEGVTVIPTVTGDEPVTDPSAPVPAPPVTTPPAEVTVAAPPAGEPVGEDETAAPLAPETTAPTP
jgi:cell division protein FtsL